MDKKYYEQSRINLLKDKNKNLHELEIDYELQESHFIVPADNRVLIEKAIYNGCSKSEELLARNTISLNEVAKTLDADISMVNQILLNSPSADLVLLDAEDATSLDPENIAKSRINVIETINHLEEKKSKIFYRPSGVELEYFVDDVIDVLSSIQVLQGKIQLDGLIIPKLENPNEARFVMQILNDLEKERKINSGSIKIQFLIESAAGVENIYHIAEVFAPRLTGIIFGMADYASELGIENLNESNRAFEYAKLKIVNTSKIFRVPAIDCMSFNYPVTDKTLSTEKNKVKILSSMKYLHDLFIDSRNLGMDGKWVGHPLQLFALKIAAEKIFNEENISRYLDKFRLYSSSATGATIIHGEMADRATNRNIKAYLRKAVIRKKIKPDLAVTYGIITREEYEKIKNF